MNQNLFFLLGISLILGGCALNPAYTTPEAPVPATWPAGDAYLESGGTPDASAAVELPWQEFITDERLRNVIELAVENNRDLRLAALTVQKYRALYGVQRTTLMPTVDVDAGGSGQRVPADLSSSGNSKISEQYSVELGVFDWEIDFFGRIRSLKDAALEEFLATEQARRSTRILLVSEVATAYLTLAADQEKLRLAETTLAAQQETYDLIKRRVDVGISSELDLSRVQTQVEMARGDIARYTQQVALDKNALNLLAGSLSPVPEALLPDGLEGIEFPRKLSAGISSAVLLKRPDILQAENLLKAAHANINAARANLFPKISLTTSIGTASNALHGLFGAGSGTWLLSPQASLPVFNAGLWATLDAARAEQEIVLAEYEKAIQTAFKEVADSLAVQGTVDQLLSAQQSLVSAASETYRLSDARYTKGIDSYLGVLDAQRSLYSAQNGLVSLRLEKFVSLVNFYSVLGGFTFADPPQ